MKAGIIRSAGVGLGVALLGAAGAIAQTPQTPQTPPQGQIATQMAPEQLNQLLAPIALYPDSLLGQVLMASTYPLEVVQADRWLQVPANAALHGDQLGAALAVQTWDPSVKSLVEFPQVLRMMDQNLDWTERLGDAFLADQGAVMDSVQRLRQLAQTAGKLQTTPQQVVNTGDQGIVIQPVSPQIVYVPIYDPNLVYGPWAWPGYPPYYFTGFYDNVVFDGYGFGWFGFPIFAPFWGWDYCDWRGHRIRIDPGRYSGLSHDHPPVGGDVWRHDADHRHGVPYADAAASARFARAAGSPGEVRSLRGFTGAVAASPGRSAGTVQRSQPIERAPPVAESFGRGADVRAEAARGSGSRMSMPNFQTGQSFHPAPTGGGGGFRGGGGQPSGGRQTR